MTPPQVHGGTSGDGNERLTLRVLDPKADGSVLDGKSRGAGWDRTPKSVAATCCDNVATDQ